MGGMKDAAATLGVSVDTIKRKMQRGELASRRETIPQGFRWLVRIDSPETEATGSPESDKNDERGVQVPSATIDPVMILQTQMEARNREVASLLATVQTQADALQHAQERVRQLEAGTPVQQSRLHHYGAAVAGSVIPVLIGAFAGFFGWVTIRVDWGSVAEVSAIVAAAIGSAMLGYFTTLLNDRLKHGKPVGPHRRDPMTWVAVIGMALLVAGALFSDIGARG